MLCNPCALNYDYVIEFDNLTFEGNRLLEYLQRFDPEESRVMFRTNHRPPRINSDKIKIAFQNISESLLESIKHIYRKDFLYLNYKDTLL